MSDEIARSDRLILRTLERSDWDDYWMHLNTPEVRAKLNGVEPRDQFERLLAENEQRQREQGYSFWAVEEISTRRFLGYSGFKNIENEPAAYKGAMEIGWAFRSDIWGQGVGAEAAQLALDAGFERFRPDHVVALTDRSNIGSWRIMEKIGMRYLSECDFQDPDFPPELNPTIAYIITHEEWSNRP